MSAEPQQPLRRSKRNRTMMEESINSEEDSIPVIVLDDETSSNEENNVTPKYVPRRRRKNEQPQEPEVKLAPIFMFCKGQKPKVSPEPVKVVEPKPRSMSDAIKNFLYSGVPEAIAKTQQIITKKRMTTELMETLDIFPVITHTNCSSNLTAPLISKTPFRLITEEPFLPLSKMDFPKGVFKNDFQTQFSGNFCCGLNSHQPSRALSKIMKRSAARSEELDPLPWVTKYRLRRDQFLAVNDETQKSFKDWLKQWSLDIKEDGGASRKTIIKKRKKGNDSDFIYDSDDDGTEKHKSVLLVGPPGSAKSTMVYVLAKRLGFKVLEVNFSSRRSGQEILRRVEEATLSRQLASPAMVDKKNCLILFRDIDQLYPEEDEGFYGALAQLITASLRPIVMTITSNHPNPPIDVKIERKDPLWIVIGTPTPDLIITNVLLPIVNREIRNIKSGYVLAEANEDTSYIRTILEAIVRHCNCDIKRSINQTQLLWATSFNLHHVHATLCQTYNTDFITHAGSFNFEFPSKANTSQEDMDNIAQNFKFVTDLDRLVSSTASDPENDGVPHCLNTYFNSNLDSILENHPNQKHSKNKDNRSLLNVYRALMLESDSERTNFAKRTSLYEDIVSKYLEQDGNGNFDEVAYFRTILKTGIINSIGQNRRNNRVRSHFSNLPSRDVIDTMCDNLDFAKYLKVAKEVGVTVLQVD